MPEDIWTKVPGDAFFSFFGLSQFELDFILLQRKRKRPTYSEAAKVVIKK